MVSFTCRELVPPPGAHPHQVSLLRRHRGIVHVPAQVEGEPARRRGAAEAPGGLLDVPLAPQERETRVRCAAPYRITVGMLVAELPVVPLDCLTRLVISSGRRTASLTALPP